MKQHSIFLTIIFLFLFAGENYAQNLWTKLRGNRDIILKEINIGNFSKIEASGGVKVIYTQQNTKSNIGTLRIDEYLVDRVEIKVVNNTLYIGQTKESQSTKKPKFDATTFTVTVSSPKLESVTMHEASTFISEDSFLKGNNFKLICSGSSNVSCAAIAYKTFNISLSGASKVSMGSIESSTGNINLSGASKLKIEKYLIKETSIFNISGASKIDIISGSISNCDLDISGASKFEAPNCPIKKLNTDISGASKAFVNATNSIKAEVSGVSKLYYEGTAILVSKKVSGRGEILKK